MGRFFILIFCVILAFIAIFYLLNPKIKERKYVIAKPSESATIKQSSMQITSSAFKNNGNIPSKFSCQGEGINPQLSFIDVPKKAKSLVLIMDDPDAPIGTFVHWVIYNISPVTTEIKENSFPNDANFGKNGMGKTSYVAACPPSGTHRYFFKLYALDTILNFVSIPDKKSVENALQEHILEKGQLIGLYKKT